MYRSSLSLVVVAFALLGCGTFAQEAAVEPIEQVPEPLPEPLPEPPTQLPEQEVLIEEETPAPAKPVRAVPKKAPAAKKKQPATLKGMRRASLTLSESKPKALGNARIKSIISERIPQVRACYERELKRNSQLEGKVTAVWTITPGGLVRSVRIKKNTTSSSALGPCIKKAVAKWRFPASSSSSDVEYPFVFRSKEKWR